MTLLEIENLSVEYRTGDGRVRAVDDVSLDLEPDESLGIVGESGSGKTTLLKTINKLLPDNALIPDGSITFDGVDLTTLSESEINKYRWKYISMIPQSSMNALDPVYTVRNQIREVISVHSDLSTEEADARAAEMFELVGLDPERLDNYPHQFSGGMRQRAVIALALVLNPDVILADEPTTALDVIIQKQIMDNIATIQKEIETALVLVTHDISVVSEMCDKIAVFYGGRLVEYGATEEVIQEPYHPYTLGLQNAFPSIHDDDQTLVSIPGTPLDLSKDHVGCEFADRCPFAIPECEVEPHLESVADGHMAKCHRTDEIETLRADATNPSTWTGGSHE